ncbi:MAG: hypothetical protein KGJ55_12475, partial [Gammaproteobacteria bacterium]|nr:hypothetical protein [Gammaproteobacteria bacterium]
SRAAAAGPAPPPVEITPDKPEPQPREPAAAANDPAGTVTPSGPPEPPPLAASGGDWALRRLLRLDTWYRVYDADLEQTRWLKLDAFDIRHGVVAFSGFDTDTRLQLSLARFAADVASGLSEPINPSDDERAALAALRRRHSALASSQRP